ncbi:MAG TPA: dihydropteroate synthase [Solirubrobacteraceae bacterium]
MSDPYRLMGVINATPDSFSDGGLFLDADAAVAQAIRLAGEGADILDVGGESTRPGAEPVALEEELRRVLPVVEGIAASLPDGPQISIDTTKAAVARRALESGATLVNDVSAFRADPEMAATVAAAGADCCLMHMRGEPRTMQRGGGPQYDDVVEEVGAFLHERLEYAMGEGIASERIMLDPGIGFGKTAQHNLELLRRLDELVALGRPIVIGTSRKAFIGRVSAAARGREEPAAPSERLGGTIATNVLAFERGARVFRVHDVGPVGDALALAAATLTGRWTARNATTTPRS